MKQIMQFPKDKTYFGINIHHDDVKVSDIEKLPFFDIFVEYAGDHIFLSNGKESVVTLMDWEYFCNYYILKGQYCLSN